MTSSQKTPLAAWSLLLSQRQEFLISHLAQVPVTTNQKVTHEMRDEVLSSVGVQDMDTSGYQLSDLIDVQFDCRNDQHDLDAVFSPGTVTSFLPTAFDDLEKGGSAGNFILLEEEGDEENFPPTTPVSERPTRSTALLRSRPFGRRIESIPDIFSRKIVWICFTLFVLWHNLYLTCLILS